MPKIITASLAVAALCLLGPTLVGSDVTVKVIQSENDLPEKFCSLWQKGDFLVSDGHFLLLIGGTPRPQKTLMNYPAPDAMGSFLGFVPAGKKLQSTLNIGAPQIRIKNKTDYVAYKTVSPGPKDSKDGSLSFECAGFYEKADWGKAEVKTTYQFIPGLGKIVLSSTITNTGTSELKDLSYSLYFSANHSYSFTPYNRTAFPQLNFRIYPRKDHYLAWLNSNPVEEPERKYPDKEEPERRYPGKLAPGGTFKVHYVLYVDTRPDTLLQALYQTLNVKARTSTLAFKNVEGRFLEMVVREIHTSTIFFRTFLEEPFTLDIPLPEGQYMVRANFFPAVREKPLAVKPDTDNFCMIENPASGRVNVKITNSRGEYVPGKISVIGLDPTKTPYFRPENPRDTGRGHEGFKNSVFPPEEGMNILLPVGIYLVSASRGPEYTRDEKIVEILKDDIRTIVFSIDKVIDTPNLISLDPHMHTQNSDGQVLVPERLRSVVAEGVDVAVATDHNFITDYATTLKRLGLNKYLAVILGSEVTKSRIIHYNTYPLKYIAEEDDHGAIDTLTDDVAGLFLASRTRAPQAVLQVNHARSGDLGYFNNFRLDKESAAFASNNFDLSFLLMEAMNGPRFSGDNQDAIEDWLHLLNRGYYFPIVGSSDAHGIDGEESGFSRTYIYYSGGKGDALDTNALFQALRKGRSFVSNGPFIDFKVNAAFLPGDSLTAKGGKIDVAVKVTSSPWVSVDEVRLIVNGERTIVFPVKPAETSLEKFRQSLSLILERDATLAVEVLGKKTLYPVVQQQTTGGLPSNATLPYALTNPVFVDVDGNGKYDPVWPEKVKIKADVGETK